MYNFKLLKWIIGEEYTTKTCGNCGTLENNIGDKKEWSCKNCKVSFDRDINGARNIMLKYFTENASSLSDGTGSRTLTLQRYAKLT